MACLDAETNESQRPSSGTEKTGPANIDTKHKKTASLSDKALRKNEFKTEIGKVVELLKELYSTTFEDEVEHCYSCFAAW